MAKLLRQLDFTVGLSLALKDAAPRAHTVQRYATSCPFRILCDNQVIMDHPCSMPTASWSPLTYASPLICADLGTGPLQTKGDRGG